MKAFFLEYDIFNKTKMTMKTFEELKAAFTHDLHIDVLEIWGEDHQTNSGKKYTMIHCRYKPLCGDTPKKEYKASFWSDSEGLLLNMIKPDNRRARFFRES